MENETKRVRNKSSRQRDAENGATVFTSRVPTPLWMDFKAMCAARGVSISVQLGRLMNAEVGRWKKSQLKRLQREIR